MLDKIKLLLGINEDDESKDELLDLLISMCKDEAIDFCNLSEYNKKLDSAVISMVIQKYNAMGTEGLSSVSGSGVNESYIDGYSKNIISTLTKHRKIRCI